MTDRELMQQAFDAMSYGNTDEREAARLALRDRLAQPEQEPATLRIDRLNQWLDASLKDRKPLTDEAGAVINAVRAAMDASTEAHDGQGGIKIASELAASLSLCLDEYDRAIWRAHNTKGEA